MSVAWTIGGVSLASMGLRIAGGNFRTGAASEMLLQRTSAFDAAHLFSYGATVTLMRDGTPYFTGKVRSRPAFGSGSSEGQSIVIRDAWEDLEETIYQEPWAVGVGTVNFPIAVLGLDSAGALITTGAQIAAAVQYAITAGVSLQLGSVPTGLILWPTEVRNTAVAEIIRISSRLHPDWVPWIDHSTSPPTLNVTPRAALTSRSISVAGGADVTDFNITRRDDLKPEAVRITYVNATIIDGVPYRDGIVDKYPGGGPDSGPGVLSAVIELAGGQMQFQKSRIQTLTLPDTQEEAKAYLIKKFPALKDVDPAHFTVTKWVKTVVVDEEADLPEPINPRAHRLPVDDAADLPRELVRGTVEDWMQKKIGRLRIECGVQLETGATAAEKKAFESVRKLLAFTVTATDAVTKIYKGVTQWVAPEAAPTGIAQSLYTALSAYQYEGSVSLKSQDVPGTRYHGCKLNLTGGAGEWATMDAMVHSVSFDVDAGTMDISVGPSPMLSAEDFLELQRLFRSRMPTWMSEDERTSNEFGATNDPGSKGDTVSGFDQPETLQEYGGEDTGRYMPYIGGNGNQLFVSPGTVTYCRLATDDREDGTNPEAHQTSPIFPTIDGTALNDPTPPSFDVTGRSSGSLWICTQRLRCSTILPVEGGTDTERIELKNKDEKPERVPNEIHRLLCRFDLEASGGSKVVSNVDRRIASDVETWYQCADDDSSAVDSEFDSDDFNSSDMSDVPDDDPSDSQSEVECPWIAKAIWHDKQSCYAKTPKYGSVVVGFKVRIALSNMYSRCQNWVAYVTAENGLPKESATANQPGQKITAAGEIKIQLSAKDKQYAVSFYFTPTPCMVEQFLTIRLASEDKEPPHENNECCGDAAGEKRISAGSWPGWCEYGGTCGTTLLTPP